MKTLFILNPVAGRGKAKKAWLPLVELFTRSGMEVTVVPTQGRGDAAKISERMAGGYDLVVCTGGDGTLSEVVSGLMKLGARPKLGYIPTGTTNDFASSLRLPREMLKAGQRIVDGQTINLDTGLLDEKSFTYAASFGLFSDAAFSTPQEMKNRMGKLAYFGEGLRQLADIQPHTLQIEHDSGSLEGDFLFGVVSNSTSVGGLMKLDEGQVSLSDGAFEVTLIRDTRNMPTLLSVLGGILRRDYDSRFISRFQASNLKFSGSRDIRWCLDGEDGGLHRSVHIRNNQQSLAMVV